MTLSPTNDYGVLGAEGEHYKPPKRCSAPLCEATEGDVHHLFRRSKLGAQSWVRFPEGYVVGNLVRLCREHHDGVTGRVGGHRFWIRWDYDRRLYLWGEVIESEPGFPEFGEVGPLDPQPPTQESLDVPQPDTEPESVRCPQCGQRKRRAPKTAGARRRKSWLVKVPDDHEDGADVLDTLVDDLAPLLGLDPTASARYHVLVPVLVYAQQDRRSFARAIAGLGGHGDS